MFGASDSAFLKRDEALTRHYAIEIIWGEIRTKIFLERK